MMERVSILERWGLLMGRSLPARAALIAFLALFLHVPASLAARHHEVLRYELTWNGGKAGHGDITTTTDGSRVNVTVQAVSDGILRRIVEVWSRVQASFAPGNFRSHHYRFHMRSNLLPTEVVDLNFNHKTGLLAVNKQKGDERESSLRSSTRPAIRSPRLACSGICETSATPSPWTFMTGRAGHGS